ncbi:esterase [Streptomyces halstedii]|uniref:esterase n=1 Tax=Streptomyces halstedii TaxID=1944 RepID=UPI003248041D
MPDGVRGALVPSKTPPRPHPSPLGARLPRRLGRHRHLSLATTEVHLASWPTAPDNWPPLIRPTVHEVTGLCAALTFATDALDLSNRLAEV